MISSDGTPEEENREELRDYTLIKHLYHCPPSLLEHEDQNTLDLHYWMLIAENEREGKASK